MEQAEASRNQQVQEDIYGLPPEFVRGVADALDEGRLDEAVALAGPLHYSDAADLLERLSQDQRCQLVDVLRPNFDAEILVELDETVRDEVIEVLGFNNLASAVGELDSDDAVWLLDQLSESERKRILEALPSDQSAMLEQGLAFPEYSAGRLMQREVVAVPSYWNVGEVIDHLRSATTIPEDFYDIFVVDPRHRPVGRIGLSRLLRTGRQVRLAEIMDGGLEPVPVTADQEEVAFLFRQHDLVSAPVVDNVGRLLGVITIDDVVDVIDEEAADDMLRLAGVTDTDLYRAVIDTARSRAGWLFLNVGTAIVASLVIGQFAATIEQIVALAVLMPIVTSIGGNAGTQTLAVAVRSLAMKELGATNAARVIGKEVLVGLLNGILFAVIVGLVAWVWFGDTTIGLVIGAAMVVNLLVAGLFGTLIPLTLDRLKIDPAISSSVFLTMMTDVVGFLAFLGLATFFLL